MSGSLHKPEKFHVTEKKEKARGLACTGGSEKSFYPGPYIRQHTIRTHAESGVVRGDS